ncbi:transporter [Ichthyenterobacterium sp. W332]|uniref:Transporter n=1 Tax=Microcosmobacter mediterraneus TaxID=3075607 RepID=A0ABU2YGJ9_9FLAO|nr:transporter [Ichthyenterobacterium sp. W332]MDT0557006.1 transporter [Ichthyenterobacterium sp. W332]
MKKLSLTFIAVIAMSICNAQDITDAVRYSLNEVQGTARFRAMSGAFGALGGDMSAVSINPAGSAVFSTSHASVSFASFNRNNEVSYFNGLSNTSDSKFDINQAGASFVFKNDNDNSSWNKFVLSIAYDKTANYDDEWIASGNNNINSISEYFLAYAQGLRLDEISAFPGETIGEAYADIGNFYGFGHQQAFLGYESYILEPDMNSDDNTLYTTNTGTGGFNQTYNYIATGYNGKFSFNAAAQYQNQLSLGINVNTHFINYERATLLDETNNNSDATVSQIQFDNGLLTTGSGVSFQLGGILKLHEGMRIGFTYDSPTWYRITEETTQFLGTVRDDNGSNISQIIDPNIINIYPEYRLRTPGKLTGSLAFIFAKKGLISLDYSRKDYANTEFRPTNDGYFAFQNEIIRTSLTVANSYRIGGEYRIKQISLRGGYRVEGSPYLDEDIMSDLTGYSLGLGYSFGDFKLDLSFERSEQSVSNSLYNIGLTNTANLDIENTDIILSLVFDL